jgi:hypothetical protein
MFEYLKSYVDKDTDINGNLFIPISSVDISVCEYSYGHVFPSELKAFYNEIGYGVLRSPANPPCNYEFYAHNLILHPKVAVGFSQGILLYEDYGAGMLESTYELLQPGDLPIFEIADSSSFMFMKPQSDAPNAVWFMGVEKIEDSFSKFIWRLYHEDPAYFSQGWGSDYY